MTKKRQDSVAILAFFGQKVHNYLKNMPSPIATATIPVVANQILQDLSFEKNQDAYQDAQMRANRFARQERERSQQYNSLENQFAQMQRVGMNPNLLQGNAFEASSPVQNQSVSPPLQTPAQFSSEGLSQVSLNKTQEGKNVADTKKAIAETVTEDSLRDGAIRLQNSLFELQISEKNVNQDTLGKIRAEVEVLQTQKDALAQSIVESDARTTALREETNLSRASRKRIDSLLSFEKRKMQAEIGEIIARTAKTQEEREVLMANKDAIVQYAYGLKLQNYITYESKDDIIELNLSKASLGRLAVQGSVTGNKIMSFQFGQMENYSDFERKLGIASSFLNCANQAYNLTPYQKAIDNGAKLLNGSPSNNSPSVAPYPGNGNTSFSSGSFYE